jgi:hypothetical protein
MPPDEPAHSIRLHAAWEPPGPPGKAAWVRRFGRPAGIGPGHRVVLVVTGPRCNAAVRVNGAVLPSLAAAGGLWSHDVTPLLCHRNTLVIEPDAAAPDTARGSGGVSPHAPIGRRPLPTAFGEVRLDILAAAASDTSTGRR